VVGGCGRVVVKNVAHINVDSCLDTVVCGSGDSAARIATYFS
jgi:hypothetical protein